jgi:hypothetical protein
MIKEMIGKTLSRRDNMLVENERISSYRRPIRDGMWESQHVAMSRMGLNMYNPLQAECSWGYKMTSTLSELRSSSICYHINHLNHINHSSDRFSAQMTQIKQIFADKKKICGHLFKSASSVCLLPYNKKFKTNL